MCLNSGDRTLDALCLFTARSQLKSNKQKPLSTFAQPKKTQSATVFVLDRMLKGLLSETLEMWALIKHLLPSPWLCGRNRSKANCAFVRRKQSENSQTFPNHEDQTLDTLDHAWMGGCVDGWRGCRMRWGETSLLLCSNTAPKERTRLLLPCGKYP